jgi:hypothetical protein
LVVIVVPCAKNASRGINAARNKRHPVEHPERHLGVLDTFSTISAPVDVEQHKVGVGALP